MGLKLQRARGAANFHGWVPHFYGQYRDGKAIRTCALKTKLRGVPPASGLLTDCGDAAFEAAKAVAEKELEAITTRAHDKNATMAAGVSLIEQAQGEKRKDMPLPKLAAWYRKRKNVKQTDKNADWLDWHDSIINDFATWARRKRCATVYQVTRGIAQEYATMLAGTFSRSTLKKKVYWLAGAFRAYLPNTMKNPFEDAYTIAAGNLDKEDGKRVFRKPLDGQELLKLWEVARNEGALWYNIAVCAACTGMRIGDVCDLKWRNVDLRNGLLPNVPTSKTGVYVTIPIWDCVKSAANYHPFLGELRRVLETCNMDAGKDDVYVFPEAHLKYTASRAVIAAHGKRIFAKALFGDAPQAEDVTANEMTVDEIKAAIDAAQWFEKKRTRIAKCYALFAAGENYPAIKAEMQYTQYNRISMDLAEVERLTGAHIRPQANSTATTARDLLGKTRESRTVGARAASVYGWHSLRHAWVVLMMNEGVSKGLFPKEDVQAVVGHTTFAQTMEYYNPTEKQRAARIREGMSKAHRQRAAALPAANTGAVATANPFAGMGLTPEQQAALRGMIQAFTSANAANGKGGAQ